jgi:hypothetical protein
MQATNGLILTALGRQLLMKAQAGASIVFTRIRYGGGAWPDGTNPETMTALVAPAVDLAIQEITVTGDGAAKLTAVLLNSGLEAGFFHTESGIFATDPDLGEILYAVEYLGEAEGGYIRAGGGAYVIEEQVDYFVVVSNAQSVSAVIDNMVVIATKRDISDHDAVADAHDPLVRRLHVAVPQIVNPAAGTIDVAERPVLRCAPFVTHLYGVEHVASQWQLQFAAGDFSVPLLDSGATATALIAYQVPAGVLTPGETYRARVRHQTDHADAGTPWSEWSEPVSFTTMESFVYVEQPRGTLPADGAHQVAETPLLTGSPFAVVGGADTHDDTEVRVVRSGVTIHSSGSIGGVIAYQLPAGVLIPATDYAWQIRYHGAALSWSDWSELAEFRTADAFIVADEGAVWGADADDWAQLNGLTIGAAGLVGALLEALPMAEDGQTATALALDSEDPALVAAGDILLVDTPDGPAIAPAGDVTTVDAEPLLEGHPVISPLGGYPLTASRLLFAYPAIPPGSAAGGLGFWAQSPVNGWLCIARIDSAPGSYWNYTLVAAVAMAHGGSGWEYFALPAIYTIPNDGYPYQIGVWAASEVLNCCADRHSQGMGHHVDGAWPGLASVVGEAVYISPAVAWARQIPQYRHSIDITAHALASAPTAAYLPPAVAIAAGEAGVAATVPDDFAALEWAAVTRVGTGQYQLVSAVHEPAQAYRRVALGLTRGDVAAYSAGRDQESGEGDWVRAQARMVMTPGELTLAQADLWRS